MQQQRKSRLRLFLTDPVAFGCGVLAGLSWYVISHLNARQRRDYHDYMLDASSTKSAKRWT